MSIEIENLLFTYHRRNFLIYFYMMFHNASLTRKHLNAQESHGTFLCCEIFVALRR
jgi:hypothetical protein